MPPGVAAAPTPSVRTSVGSIADRPSACQRSAATARASHSVTDVNAFSQSQGLPDAVQRGPRRCGPGPHRRRNQLIALLCIMNRLRGR
jgi:hypothetical protein